MKANGGNITEQDLAQYRAVWRTPIQFTYRHRRVISMPPSSSGGLTLGLIAGIWADKFDQLAAFQNFLIMPLTMLSGVFYSIHSLPQFWQEVSRFNPVFYMIDGFRYGFFGVSDVAPETSLVVVTATFVVLAVATLALLQRGYKLRA